VAAVPSNFAAPERGTGFDQAATVQDHRTDRREIVRTPIVENEAVTWGTPQARWVLLATVLGSGMAFLDATVVNVALPTIGRELHASVAGLQWIVNGLPSRSHP
jgi:hypothetical protein